jgi:hypothetical protein
MVAEVRPNYESDWAAITAVAQRLGIGTAEKATYPIVFMCRLLGVPRSTFYAWRNRAETAIADRSNPMIRSPSQCPGTARSAASGGR